MVHFQVGSGYAADDLPQYTEGRPVFSYTSRAALQTDLTCTASQVGQVCGTDCRTLMQCNGIAGAALYSQTCVHINPKLPYCVNGACTATPIGTACATAFTCTSVGFFPDPIDCTQYRRCDTLGGDAVLLQCPDKYAYNSALNLCSLKGTCNIINCTNVNNAYTLYKGNAAYYAFCTNGLTAQITMYKCADTQNEVYDIASATCRYNCKSAGIFVNRADCNGYVTCNKINGKMTATTQKCPDGNEFKNGACITQGTTPCVSELTS